MPPVRRSTRAPRQAASGKNGADAAGAGSSTDVAPARKPKRPRAGGTAAKELPDPEPSEEITEKNMDDDTDGVDEPDFADSDEEEEDDSDKPANKRLRKATASEIASKRKVSKTSDIDASVEPESDRADTKKVSVSLQSIPKKDSIPRRKQNEPVSQSLLVASLKPAPDIATITTSSKPISSSTAPANAVHKGASSFPKQAAPTAPAPASSSRAIGGSSYEAGPLSASTSVQVQDSSRQPAAIDLSVANEANEATRPASAGISYGQRQQVPSQLTNLEKQAMNSFVDLCQSIKESDVRFKMGSVAAVDLGGSFLLRSDVGELENLDFFDRNDRGEIVLQPRLPMFPEDFPPGMKDHSLAWWGILDPQVGDNSIPLNSSRLSPPPPESNRTPPCPGMDPSEIEQHDIRAFAEEGRWNGSRPSDVSRGPRHRDHNPRDRLGYLSGRR